MNVGWIDTDAESKVRQAVVKGCYGRDKINKS